MREEEIQKIKNSSILLSICVALFAVLVLLAVLPRSIHNKNLTKTIQSSIEEYEQKNEQVGRYKLGKRIPFNSSLAFSTYVFTLTDFYDNNSDGNEKYAVLTRVVGMNGPVPVVFLGSSQQLAFCSVAGTKVQSDNMIMYGLTSTILNYHSQNLQNALSKNEKILSKEAKKKNDRKK